VSLIIGFLGIEHFTPPWDLFFLPLFNLLIAVYQVPFLDFALAIIVFTIVIRTILAPLFVKQIRSQKEMQRMQPLIREVQRKHKGNRQKVSEETMALYKEHGVNPAAGCLPVILQLPILFALYQALIRASGNVGLNEDQVASDEFARLSEQLNIVPLAQENHFRVPVDGACNLPEFGQLSQLLPLNCQLIEPIKLDQTVDTTVGLAPEPRPRAGRHRLRAPAVRDVRALSPGRHRGDPAVRAGEDDEPAPQPRRPDVLDDEHDDLHVPAADDHLGRHLSQRADPVLDRVHRVSRGAAVPHHGLGEPLPALRLAARLGAAARDSRSAEADRAA
jgi:YidC/Oxa1 family membrane protein insertase